MLYKVSEFCMEVSSDMNGLIDKLITLTGRSTNSEREAWQKSLPQVSKILARPELGNFHMHLGEPGGLILEYRLPSASAWCDLVLLGGIDETKPSAVIVELKDWQLGNDEPGPSESLVKHNGIYHLHPSDQVRGYSEYIRRFHSTVLSESAEVSGCVYFTRDSDTTPYKAYPHYSLTAEYPVFSTNENSLFTGFLASKLKLPNEEFAMKFEKGYYKQDRNLLIQVARNFKEKNSPFVLLDEQRKGFHECVKVIKDVIKHNDKKHVIIVEGPPGSGKSALAANLWAECVELVRDKDSSVVFTTTSASQRNNWEKLFSTVGRRREAKYLVKKSNDYNPGLNTNEWLKGKRNEGHSVDVSTWKENLKLFEADGKNSKAKDDLFFISIVDEAHALIDPSKKDAKGIPASGWVLHAGPQGWHIIRCSRISVFFLDGEQSYRDNETTRKEDLEEYAQDHNAEIHYVDLSGTQFRCSGSVEYVNWVNSLFFNPDEAHDASWRQSCENPKGRFIFEMTDNPWEMENLLRQKLVDGNKVRLASSYSVPWKTKDEQYPHLLPPEKMDFNFELKDGIETRFWSKIWNYAPKMDYSLFVQAPPESRMHADPLCEVGCPYVIRGFDYDYLGVLWLDDLVWRNDRWKVVPESVFESAIRKTRSEAVRQGENSPSYDMLLKRVMRGYRILLTRALKGIYLWVKDDETREHINKITLNGLYHK